MRTRQILPILLFLILPVMLLTGCRRGAEEETTDTSGDVQLEERVNRFLDESGVTLPENGERANMSDVSGGDATGVVTRETNADQTTFTVLAALPEPMGNYHAWMVMGENEYQYLGKLSPAKGGYLLETTVEGDYAGNEVVVSDETSVGTAPTTIVLRGQFGQSS